jgi:hypothetical protein
MFQVSFIIILILVKIIINETRNININSNSRLKNFRRDTLKVLKVSNHENGG